MADDLHLLDDTLQGLMQQVSSAGRKKVLSSIVKQVKQNNINRITAQTTPDGEAFAARKPQLRRQYGAIRNRAKTGAMFAKLKRTLQSKVNTDSATLDFSGSGRIAEVHHFGLVDRVRAGISVRYAARPLLGIALKDQTDIQDIMIKHLAL